MKVKQSIKISHQFDNDKLKKNCFLKIQKVLISIGAY